MISVNKRVEDFKRAELKKALSQCNQEQQKLFRKLFTKNSKGEVVESDLISAIDLCERTVVKNDKKEVT